jgi:hypothetical protein
MTDIARKCPTALTASCPDIAQKPISDVQIGSIQYRIDERFRLPLSTANTINRRFLQRASLVEADDEYSRFAR